MDIISQNLEDINAALDTDYWDGGQMFLGAIDNEFKAAIFSGNSNELVFEGHATLKHHFFGIISCVI